MLQKLGNIGDVLLVGCGYFFYGRWWGRFGYRQFCNGFFQVCRIRAIGCIDDRVFAGRGENVEFVRIIAADITCISFYRSKVQFHALQNAFIAAIHFLIGGVETRLVEMK